MKVSPCLASCDSVNTCTFWNYHVVDVRPIPVMQLVIYDTSYYLILSLFFSLLRGMVLLSTDDSILEVLYTVMSYKIGVVEKHHINVTLVWEAGWWVTQCMIGLARLRFFGCCYPISTPVPDLYQVFHLSQLGLHTVP